ncbi:hypothetical protein [Ammoniphilus sp. YIM 78166]|uniref:hypothetical protein n=1 Tax=Ammoniphilus sp. YIM 78166 TaxID=1644106 RepID=UPI00107024E6|nr:hypothetical protein [Ammoniphilus sp. YIM 78166]
MRIRLGDVTITQGITDHMTFGELDPFIQRFTEGDFGDFNVLNQKDNPGESYTGRYEWKEGVQVLIDHDIKEKLTIISLPNELE